MLFGPLHRLVREKVSPEKYNLQVYYHFCGKIFVNSYISIEIDSFSQLYGVHCGHPCKLLFYRCLSTVVSLCVYTFKKCLSIFREARCTSWASVHLVLSVVFTQYISCHCENLYGAVLWPFQCYHHFISIYLSDIKYGICDSEYTDYWGHLFRKPEFLCNLYSILKFICISNVYSE